MTKTEVWLWLRIRGYDDVKFRRQHPIGPYILDFYCAAARLAVEVDGDVHDDVDQQEHDAARTAWLAEQGVSMLRLPAKAVLSDPDGVAAHVLKTAKDKSAS